HGVVRAGQRGDAGRQRPQVGPRAALGAEGIPPQQPRPALGQDQHIERIVAEHRPSLVQPAQALQAPAEQRRSLCDGQGLVDREQLGERQPRAGPAQVRPVPV
ncbi:MAG: hypothetical protein ACK559_32025, partial [bacterium]